MKDEEMYGPIVLGGPCPKCGGSQPEHVGKTCRQVRKEQEQKLKGILKPVLKKLRKKNKTY